jgi:hypothetical protein
MSAAAAQDYVFERPFLVLMRVRATGQPVFAMWVGNTDLLTAVR